MSKLIKKIRVEIYPLPGMDLSGEHTISDHINLSGYSPPLGFNAITELYTAKGQADAIVVACLRPGVVPTDEEAEQLKDNGVSAYCYALLEHVLYAAAQGIQVDAVGYVPVVPQGFKLAAAAMGLKAHPQLKDLGLIVADEPCLWAGTFTQNSVRASCVNGNVALYDSNNLIQALVCNSGNANACTGDQGAQADQSMRKVVATKLGSKADQVLSASTGKIGVQLPIDKIVESIQAMDLGDSLDHINGFAESIITTDKITKISQDPNNYILGFAKGSGMIEPNMATMLAFLISDVKIAGQDAAEMQQTMRQALQQAVAKSFNAISVDSDTSPNDMVLMLSSCSGPEISLEDFQATLDDVCIELAKKIVLDGEGATKLIELTVAGADDQALARKIAKQILNSPLVKTAIFGCDPNWGRIIMVLGNALDNVDLAKVELKILDQPVFSKGAPVDIDRPELSNAMKINKVIKIDLDLGLGDEQAINWGCDLSYEYVRINAEYFT